MRAKPEYSGVLTPKALLGDAARLARGKAEMTGERPGEGEQIGVADRKGDVGHG